VKFPQRRGRRPGQHPAIYVRTRVSAADDRAWRKRAQKRIAADVAWVEKQLASDTAAR